MWHHSTDSRRTGGAPAETVTTSVAPYRPNHHDGEPVLLRAQVFRYTRMHSDSAGGRYAGKSGRSERLRAV